ncbi:zinc finger protein CONSTANS-LIKE 16-like [Henckelia pumila]|uniref:zinc finger protein CONSTANS-LIKE 16-like n=1 Tax=Henckelia pumila TaxID=405737 RepID=UPI003C6DCDF9
MMSSGKSLSNAVGAKSARACDSCIKKRARWYCAADDAFLCQSCDSSVHSANTLARRHERVCLKIASIKSLDAKLQTSSVPSWHQGFTRKARTPRHKKHSKFSFSDESIATIQNPLHLVPEISGEDHSHDENEEQLLYRVPIFDPFVAELCNSGEVVNNNNIHAESVTQVFGSDQFKGLSNDLSPEMKRLHGFLPSEADLAEFAADVESLLGKGLEDELFDMEGLGLMDSCDDQKEKVNCDSLEIERVKVEEEYIAGEDYNHHDDQVLGVEIDLGRETFELNFDYDSPITCEEVETKAVQSGEQTLMNSSHVVGDDLKKVNFLRLDYDGVMTAWDGEKSPWMTGERPEIDLGDCWPDCMGTSGVMHAYGEMGMTSGHAAAMLDGGREARVSRYREKRRTRLFSKKIRYEVRKLNAEKRPRMKGRFVKRANFVNPASAVPVPLLVPLAK